MKKLIQLAAIILFAVSANAVDEKNTATKDPAAQPARDISSASQKYDYNFRFSPIGLLVGLLNAEFDYAISDKITVGPSVSYLNLKVGDISVTGFSIGAQSRYFFDNFASDSWYLSGRGMYSNVEASITSLNVKYTGTASGLNLGFGGGYHWFWESFNMNLGGGIITGQADVELKDSAGTRYSSTASSGSSAFLEYTIGWMF